MRYRKTCRDMERWPKLEEETGWEKGKQRERKAQAEK